MIEVIYKEEKQEAKNGENLFNLPRNIRQVGLTTGNMRIYIEDYVYTFLTRLARNAVGSGKEQGCVAVFTGETKWNNGITYLFIRGALMVEDMEAASDHIDFSEKIWAKIQEDQAKYFPGQEITGWFFSRPQMYMETDELLTRIHLRYFGGEKVLMLMEPAEKEEAFFFFENGLMVRQRGYYIYYEKNPLMQEYMIEKNKDFAPEFTENVSDEAVVSFRKIIRNKKTKKAEKTEEKPQEEMERTSVFSYAATACLVLAVLAVGAGFYRNYCGLPVQPEDDYAVTVMSGKTEEDALTEAKIALGATTDEIEYEVLEKGTSGFLGIGSKPAVIQARKKCSVEDYAREFLNNVFAAMKLEVEILIKVNDSDRVIEIELKGDDMGILIGKRGQTLDSLQQLTNLAVNKKSDVYYRVKMDTEDYRKRRKETLENLAKNIAYKVKRTKHPVSLEPMNPFERRVIHSALQNDRYVTTHSEGEEPYRHVVVTLKK